MQLTRLFLVLVTALALFAAPAEEKKAAKKGAAPGAAATSGDLIDVNSAPAAVLKSLVKHPLTDKGIEMFLADWKKTGQTIA